MDALGLMVVIAIVFPFAFAAFWTARGRRRSAREQRLRLHARAGLPHPGLNAPRLPSREQAQPGLANLLRLAPRILRQTGVGLGTLRRLLLAAGLCLAVGVLLSLLHPHTERPGMLLLLAGAGAPPGFLFWRYWQRRRRLAAQFPEALESIVRALQAGITVDTALRMAANDFPAPLGDELGRATKQIQLGVPIRDALRELQERVGLPEVDYFVITVLIQRESGGQVAKVLGELARTMRRRALFQGKLRALTAESRFTALFIGGVPLLFIAYKYLFDQPSLEFFLHDPAGKPLFALALALIATGSVILRFMLRIRI